MNRQTSFIKEEEDDIVVALFIPWEWTGRDGTARSGTTLE